MTTETLGSSDSGEEQPAEERSLDADESPSAEERTSDGPETPEEAYEEERPFGWYLLFPFRLILSPLLFVLRGLYRETMAMPDGRLAGDLPPVEQIKKDLHYRLKRQLFAELKAELRKTQAEAEDQAEQPEPAPPSPDLDIEALKQELLTEIKNDLWPRRDEVRQVVQTELDLMKEEIAERLKEGLGAELTAPKGAAADAAHPEGKSPEAEAEEPVEETGKAEFEPSAQDLTDKFLTHLRARRTPRE